MSKKITFDQDRYRSVCATHADRLPVFFQDWWLDIVCGSTAWEVMLYEEDPHIVAIYPMWVRHRGPVRYVTMPPLTRFAGPFFLKDFSEYKQHRILRRMAEAMPRLDGYAQTWHYQITNWLPWRWQGFQQTIYYSFVLPDLTDLDAVYGAMAPDYRNNKIAKLSDRMTVALEDDPTRFWHLFAAPFLRQGLSVPFGRELLQRIGTACRVRDCGTCLYAEDADGQALAAVYLLWDAFGAYLLLAGSDEEGRNEGAEIYLIWKAITYASSTLGVRRFDFLGGMAPGLERTRRQFGAVPESYFYVTRQSTWFKLLQRLRQYLGR